MPKSQRIPLKIGGFLEIVRGRKKAKVRFDIWASCYEVSHNFAEKVLEIFTKYEKPKGTKNFLIGKCYGCFVLHREHAKEFAQQLKQLLEDPANLSELIEIYEVESNAKNKMAPKETL